MSKSKEPKYPYNCNCGCGKVIKNKSNLDYHLNRSTLALSKMPVKRKAEEIGEVEAFMNLFPTFDKYVSRSCLETDTLTRHLTDTGADETLTPESRCIIRRSCKTQIRDFKVTHKDIIDNTTAFYDTLEAGSQTHEFIDALSTRSFEENATKDNSHPIYVINDVELNILESQLAGKLEAVQYEKLRREFKPRKVVCRFLRKRLATSSGYTQDSDASVDSE